MTRYCTYCSENLMNVVDLWLNTRSAHPLVGLWLSICLLGRWPCNPSLVFYFDESCDASSVLKHICFFLKVIASQARDQNRPKVPVYDTPNNSARG